MHIMPAASADTKSERSGDTEYYDTTGHSHMKHIKQIVREKEAQCNFICMRTGLLTPSNVKDKITQPHGNRLAKPVVSRK